MAGYGDFDLLRDTLVSGHTFGEDILLSMCTTFFQSFPKTKKKKKQYRTMVIMSTEPWPVKVAPPCTQNGLSYSWRTLAPDPYNGGVFGTPLAVAVQNELLAFCKPYGHIVPFISAIPPLRVFSAARLS